MLVLGIDTATPAVSVALVDGDEPRAARSEVAVNRHGELLAPLIDAVLRSARVRPGELAAIAVGLGPGPFTGLRVGIVTAQTIADALGVPAYGDCSLDVIAAAVSERPLLVMTDARRRQVYWAEYDAAGRVGGPDIAPPPDVLTRLAGRVDYVAGAGAMLHRDRLSGLTLIDASPYPDPTIVARRGATRLAAGEPGDRLQPMYLRRPDARLPGPPKQVTPA